MSQSFFEITQLLEEKYSGCVCIALDADGNAEAKATNLPVTLSFLVSKCKSKIAPQDLLTTIDVLETLVGNAEKKSATSGKGRKTGRKKSGDVVKDTIASEGSMSNSQTL